MPSKEEVQEWMDLIDGAAHAANAGMQRFAEAADAAGDAPLQVRALHLIALEVAYANVLAAADFYMAYVADREDERG